MTVLGILVSIALLVYVCYVVFVKPYKQASKYFEVNVFMQEVDSILTEFVKYDVIRKLRDNTLAQLTGFYEQSPKEFEEFYNSVNKRIWAYKYICSITLDELCTGKYHIYNKLKPEGQILKNVNIKCLQEAYNRKYINKKEFEEAMFSLEKSIKETGN